ncbi:hypothetical protein ACWGHM_15130 [Streptomyces sp. NPDC054904]|nr:hypothetical protein [Streptomyces sp. Isolate_45]MDA5281199.1 hypothetical protein [Streptomyces sp. Isolate_45]
MNPISDLNHLPVEDFELEAATTEVQAAARQCGSLSSCCSCSRTPELSA